ncbi:MAG TPA: lanthionine synthetase LanC family protein, partial [Thermoanaerobaculia bacterium]|nr:lanthionine synthetase LanC family protein [Thermoanaerobaculia bacterium]
AVAALLYLLLTGSHYRDFSLEREALLRQIAEEPPLPFAERGVPPWPEAEKVLTRALAKRPRDRYPSLAALARALAGALTAGGAPVPEAAAPGRRAGKRGAGPAPAGAAAARWGGAPAAAPERLLDRMLARLGPADAPAEVIAGAAHDQGAARNQGNEAAARAAPEPPLASINNGAAGIACALYRIALAREDAALLAHADLWASRAVDAARRRGDAAFYDPRRELTKAIVGRVSPYHTASGAHGVAALIAHAQGDTAAQQAATAAFLAAVRAPCAAPDLTLGRAGVLLAAALLLDAAASARLSGAVLDGLRQLGRRRLAWLWRQLDELPPATAGSVNLGIAHGWAGWLYASLRWCRAAAAPLPPRLAERLDQLADCAEPWRRGLCWRWHGAPGAGRSDSPAMPGWCNGSAGFVHLWTLAHRQLGEPRHAALAEGAAWNAWEDPAGGASLCCGLAGRAYALLELYRCRGGGEWLERARTLAERATAAAGSAARPDSLYRGALGVAVLAADLARPDEAVMPFFADEGWRAAQASLDGMEMRGVCYAVDT